MVGTTLNHYRVLRQIGIGGMGEVFEAEDTRLHRKVALKVLPPAVASDPERRQRFEREAQAVAALNHPNIVTIYSVEENSSTGSGQAGVPFLTMELVEGTTLGDLIPAGGLPIERVLRIGAAIADAIAAAQQRGITHRDLKPANVMVTASGQVKVLDFGLAKLRDLEANRAASGPTTLATGELTGEGRILGTVSYMSPEQAEGKPVDSRSDIFSLGIILHQMATGDQPFKGDTPVSVISSILKDTPSSVTDLKPGLPSDLARIVKRCLAKDPERRYQTALDLRNDLDELKQIVDSGTMAAAGSRPSASSGRPELVEGRPAARGRRPGLAAIGAAVIVLGVAAVLAWMYVSQSRAPQLASASKPTVSFEDMKIRPLTSSGRARTAAISPDGRFVVHVVDDAGQQSLWIRQVATSSDVRIVPPAQVRYQGVTVSPDGTYVYYNAYVAGSGVASLYQLPVLGGAARRILEDIDSAVTFSPDGARMAFVRGIPDPPGSVIVVANADGTGERVLASRRLPDQFNLVQPAWSPDGRTIAASGTTVSGTLPQRIVLVDAETGAERTLGGDWFSLEAVAWVADGSAAVVAGAESGATIRQIWRVGYPRGETTRVTNDLANYSGLSLSADSRTLTTVQTETLSAIWVMPVGDAARARPITSGPRRRDGRSGLAWTPDERLVYESSTDGEPNIWIMDADGNDQKRLTQGDALNVYPAVCDGGRSILYTSVRGGSPQVWRMDPDGGNATALVSGKIAARPLCPADADTVVFAAIEEGGQPAQWRMGADGRAPVKLSEHLFEGQSISPAGDLVAGGAWDPERRRESIALLETANPGSLRLLRIDRRAVSWFPSGRTLGYVDFKDGADNVWMLPIPDGRPTQVTHFESEFIFRFAWSPDGKRLALSRGTQSTDVVLLTAAR